MPDSERTREQELQDLAAQEMVRQAVGLLTTLAMAAGIAYVIGHRYVGEQLARRARAWLEHKRDPDRVKVAREVADLQRAISRYEHEQAEQARPGRRRGLYERGP